MKARIVITLKPGVLDPQGKAIEGALAGLGFKGVQGVRQGKFIELELDERDPERAREQIREMCERLLANTVIENYRFELDEPAPGDRSQERGESATGAGDEKAAAVQGA